MIRHLTLSSMPVVAFFETRDSDPELPAARLPRNEFEKPCSNVRLRLLAQFLAYRSPDWVEVYGQYGVISAEAVRISKVYVRALFSIFAHGRRWRLKNGVA
jgi:hypothetical protein